MVAIHCGRSRYNGCVCAQVVVQTTPVACIPEPDTQPGSGVNMIGADLCTNSADGVLSRAILILTLFDMLILYTVLCVINKAEDDVYMNDYNLITKVLFR